MSQVDREAGRLIPTGLTGEGQNPNAQGERERPGAGWITVSRTDAEPA